MKNPYTSYSIELISLPVPLDQALKQSQPLTTTTTTTTTTTKVTTDQKQHSSGFHIILDINFSASVLLLRTGKSFVRDVAKRTFLILYETLNLFYTGCIKKNRTEINRQM